jgi:hypothetical protein
MEQYKKEETQEHNRNYLLAQGWVEGEHGWLPEELTDPNIEFDAVDTAQALLITSAERER